MQFLISPSFSFLHLKVNTNVSIRLGANGKRINTGWLYFFLFPQVYLRDSEIFASIQFEPQTDIVVLRQWFDRELLRKKYGIKVISNSTVEVDIALKDLRKEIISAKYH